LKGAERLITVPHSTKKMIKLAIFIGIFLPIGLSVAYLIYQRAKLSIEEKRIELDAKRDEQTRKMLESTASVVNDFQYVPRKEKVYE